MQDAADLRQAQRQVAGIFRDVIVRNQVTALPLQGAWTGAKVVFAKGSSNLTEYVDLGEGWRSIRPNRLPLHLTGGVVVSSWYPENALIAETVWQNGRSHVFIRPCVMTLTSPGGARANVYAEADGRVWYK